MTGEAGSEGALGFEAFGTACGLAVVAGALAVVTPMLDGLTVTLVALALAGWASLHRREGRISGRFLTARPTHLAAFAVLATAVGLFFDPPPTVAPWKALLLGLALVPLWASERWPLSARGPPWRMR